ncbi:MAG: dTDP-4-dehydrorhamnose 3,5-epimerase family protein, partial [Proteobacteria bacterium]|nr:dTDP-4-dehydrorhamnose 3,5-epimerase family protein [Pseudomonadota bacterium]
MQTHLRGRDMITTQEWTKDELDTVIDVAVDLRPDSPTYCRWIGVELDAAAHRAL